MSRFKILVYRHPYLFYLVLFTGIYLLFQLYQYVTLEQRDNRGRSPVFLAAEHGDLKTLKALLDEGAVVDDCDNCRWTPMMKAAQNGHVKVVELLLEHGADMNARDKGGYSAIMVAAGDKRTDVVRLLAENHAELDYQDDAMGWTALIWAAKNGYPETASVLLEAGADADIADYSGKTAAQWACQSADPLLKDVFSNISRSSDCRLRQ